MSHEISVTGTLAHMAYARQLPWHGLGVPVPEDATPSEAARAAKLDWTCRAVPLTLSHSTQERIHTGTAALVREDLWNRGEGQNAVLGTAPTNYEPVQNAKVAEALTGVMECSGTRFETAGSLSHGQRNWFALNLGIPEEVAPADRIEMYLVLVNRFDRQCIEARLTPVRVVCSNTLSFSAMLGLTTELAHSMVTPQSIGTVSDLLCRVHRTSKGLYRLMSRMATTPINAEQLEAMLATTFPDPAETTGGIATREVRRARRDAKMLFEVGTGNEMEGVAGSVWAAINGVTEYLDHRREDPATKLESIWFGEGHRAKLRAFQYAMLLVKHPGEVLRPTPSPRLQMMLDTLSPGSRKTGPKSQQDLDPRSLGVRV